MLVLESNCELLPIRKKGENIFSWELMQSTFSRWDIKQGLKIGENVYLLNLNLSKEYGRKVDFFVIKVLISEHTLFSLNRCIG